MNRPAMTALRASGVWLAVIIATCAADAACTKRRAHVASGELQNIVAKPAPAGTRRAVWDDVRAFYAQREHAPAWIGDSAPSARAKDALRVIASANEHGLLASDYDEQAIARLLGELSTTEADQASADRLTRLAQFDVRVTTALLGAGPGRGDWAHDARVDRSPLEGSPQGAGRRGESQHGDRRRAGQVARGDPASPSRVCRAPEGARGHDGRPAPGRLAESARGRVQARRVAPVGDHAPPAPRRHRRAPTRRPETPRGQGEVRQRGRKRGPRLSGTPRTQDDGCGGCRHAGRA